MGTKRTSPPRLALDAFVSHAAIALPAGRKTDLAGFDWERFRRGVRKV